jgi:hypothetical protein
LNAISLCAKLVLCFFPDVIGHAASIAGKYILQHLSTADQAPRALQDSPDITKFRLFISPCVLPVRMPS